MARSWDSEPLRRAVPSVEHPDESRFAFWKPHATPIQVELLRLTGWLSDEMDREVVVPDAEGEEVVHDASGRPVRVSLTRKPSSSQNVLFRLEKPGTKERADWEWYFLLVRRVQVHGRLLRQKVTETNGELAKIDERIIELHAEKERLAVRAESEVAAFRQKVKRLERAARVGLAKHRKPAPNGPYARLAAMVPEGKALAEKWAETTRELAARTEIALHERAPVARRLEWLARRSDRHIFAGLFSVINAFLDVQALSAASVAIEEFRKAPQHSSAVIEEMEARLATD